MLKSIVFTLTLLFSSVSFSQIDSVSLKKAKIVAVKIREIEPNSELLSSMNSAAPIADVIMTIDSLLALGSKVWSIIEQGRPVVTTNFAQAVSIIPNIDGTNVVLNNMENWSLPHMISYRISFVNALDFEVVGFTYTIFFQHSGSYNGKGKYVTNLKVQASDVYSMWGSDLTASSELIGISNIGSKDAPVASGIIQVSYTAKGVVNQNVGARSFFVDGNGHIAPIND